MRTPGEFADSGEPAAEIVVDFDGVGMRQHAGAARQPWSRRIEVVEKNRAGGQRRRGPDQRGGDQQALEAAEPPIDIIARGVAERDFGRLAAARIRNLEPALT